MIELTWQHNPTADAPVRHRRACKYAAYLPDPISDFQLTLDGSLMGLVSEAEAAIQALNASARPALKPLARLLLRSEAIASSKIEGMQMGTRELANAEARVEAGGHGSPLTLELLANIEAMEVAIHEATEVGRFGIPQILSIHRRLMERTHPRIAGRLRSEQNWIGGNDYNPCGADFVPPPPEHIVPLLDDLCSAIAAEEQPPLVQAAIVHAQFETIHPFEDGNGRTGRALIHVVLRRRGLAPEYVPPISVILARRRDRYIEGLTRFRADRIADWIDHFAGAAASSARLAAGYVEAVGALQEEWRSRLDELPDRPREDAAAWALIDVLPAYPLITGPVAIAATGRSKPSVYQGIDQLERAGVFIVRTVSKRYRVWESAGLMDLLEGLESGEAP